MLLFVSLYLIFKFLPIVKYARLEIYHRNLNRNAMKGIYIEEAISQSDSVPTQLCLFVFRNNFHVPDRIFQFSILNSIMTIE